MNRIRLLPEHVANQIAAGEVVERPSSVVKELVENALDAAASRIHVDVLAAGRGLIRVSDDGCGMSRDDALLCLERHATSKITVAADLSRVVTMGFRGEAIPSIASVSRLTLTTRDREATEAHPTATQIVMNGGKILEVREAAGPLGTTVEVRSLFFNVPARRKFLRSDETERAHIQHWLTTAALAHPEVAFSVTFEGRTAWQLPALPQAEAQTHRLRTLRERLRLLLGEGLAWVPVDTSGELEAVRLASSDPSAPAEVSPPSTMHVWGWIGAPGVSRATREDQHIFVNRRPVENRGVNAALVEGYHNVLMKGRYPLSCLFLELDPSEVDVNVHPAKREVKFHRERPVRGFVAAAVRQALAEWHQPTGAPVLEVTAAPGSGAALPPAPRRSTSEEPTGASRVPVSGTAVASGVTAQSGRAQAEGVGMEGTPSKPGTSPGLSGPNPQPQITVSNRAAPGTVPAAVPIPVEAPVPLLSVPLRLVGVIGRLYVVLESDRGLVMMDQHAAHERVLYEQMLRRVEQGGSAPSQRLLLPETIELSPKDAAFVRENLAALSRLGVGLSEFGERTFLLDALPPFVKASPARRFAMELLDELRAAGTSINAWRLGEAVVAKTVCRHAVKANDPLAGPEIESLIEDLRRCDMPYTCPHGRPTLIEMNYRELEKKFGRVQG